MDFYVVAFSDRPWSRRRVLDRWYQSVPIGGLYAIGERRAAAPPPTDVELRHQHAVVAVLANEQAVLPVRFGALLCRAALKREIGRHEAVLRRGLDEVRGRVQMNVRFVGDRPPSDRADPAVRSGREYLERRRASVATPLDPDAVQFLGRLDQVAVRQRLEPGTGRLLATAYHLVPRELIDQYRELSGAAEQVGAIVTGPYPPFAFTPEIL